MTSSTARAEALETYFMMSILLCSVIDSSVAAFANICAAWRLQICNGVLLPADVLWGAGGGR